ncbi:MAG: type II toxin-antitoxin system Phd/YefM family antitoxin [Candidatus Caenarcaniphilales bacterium]|nr:type II toxin-antitoxin system Phd/YefM family antitoxin [Candidatus Caenarcaniphilales bacterium]
MKSIGVMQFKEKLDSILAELASSEEPIQITGTHHNGVLLSEKDWIAIQEALYYLSIPGVIESIEGNGAKMIEAEEYSFGMN